MMIQYHSMAFPAAPSPKQAPVLSSIANVIPGRIPQKGRSDAWLRWPIVPITYNLIHPTVESLALIGKASVHDSRVKTCLPAEAFSIRRLEGSRWRLRRTL